jgi:rhodanese-related sulfurtransferase
VRWRQKRLVGDNGIGPKDAEDLVRSGAVFLAAREQKEWYAGHAPGARHLPLGSLQGSFGSLPRDRRVVVVCRSGIRSARATALLVRSGFEAVDLNGGMRAWAAAGLPLEAAGTEPGMVM